MITLVGSEDEERVALVDSGFLAVRENFPKAAS
jgi:hypothetical protein